MIVFNLAKPGLNDFAVRKAIAMVIDYTAIGVNAMSGYTAPKEHHLMLPLDAERNLVDMDALKQYQWNTMDVAGANALLDQAGWVRGADGVRAKGGVRLAFQVTCPYGWTDWNASLEIVAQSTRPIGIALETYFPDQPVWERNRNYGDFDITMMLTSGPGAASPWNMMYTDLSSTHLPTDPNQPVTVGNHGRWVNAEANQIINQIPTATGDQLKQLYTRLNIIYLQNLPFIGVMYRPWVFHQVMETVWTGFPIIGDGSNVPPQILCDGYGIVGLYNLRLK
jgi:peptide/nickel transport system substrate-binding protein